MLANSIETAYIAVDPERALPSGDPRYVDLTEFRGGDNIVQDIARQIRWTDLESESPMGERRFSKLLVTGHRGCGKTTELLRLKAELEKDGYFVVFFDAELELNKNDVDWSDIILTIVRQVDEQVRNSNLKIKLREKVLENIGSWIAEVVVERKEKSEQEAQLESQFGVGANLPFFVKVSLALKAIFKTSSSQVKIVRQEVEKKASLLFDDINTLLDDLQIQLKDNNKRGLVIIVDGLEKIILRPLTEDTNLTSHSSIYIEHGEHLKTPKCHIVYTMPISLLREEYVGEVFIDAPSVIPMVKVRNSEGDEYPDGIAKMCEMIHRRIDVPEVFESASILNDLCLASGGHVKDFLRLVRYACRYADNKIDNKAAQKAINELVREYDYLVKDGDIEKLVKVHKERRIPSDPEYARLSHQLLVLEYRNQERWADVHPMVKQTRKVREVLT
jgi:hypothetical protein